MITDEQYIVSLSQRMMGHRQMEFVELSTQTELPVGSPQYITFWIHIGSSANVFDHVI